MPEQSTLERTFLTRLIQLAPGLPEPTAEYQFAPGRKWRFDFCWPELKVAVECEGLTREGGRHQRTKGYSDDAEKYNAAIMNGWKVLRFTNTLLTNDPFTCIAQVKVLVMQSLELETDHK